MSKAYDKVMAGLGDAQGYLNGNRDGFVVHEIEVPEPDIVAIRGKTGLSQLLFVKTRLNYRRKLSVLADRTI